MENINRLVGKNLDAALQKEGRSKSWLASKVNKEPASITRYISGETNMSIAQIKEMADAIGISVSVLLKGIDYEDNLGYLNESPTGYRRGIPYFNVPVHAGEVKTHLTSENITAYITIPGVKGLAAFDIVGNSMKGEIHDGSFIVVDKIDSYERVDPVKLYMVVTRDDRMAKRLYYDPARPEVVTAISNNYPNFTIFVNEILELYRIVFIGERL